MSMKNLARLAAAAFLAAVLAVLAGCTSHGGDAGAARSAAASVTADPRVHAELDQAKALVKTCFAGTPLAQIHQVHLVFLSRASGKNGPDVVKARDKTFTCLGIPENKRDEFKNAAITAAEQQKPKILSLHPAAGVRQYLLFTLPKLIATYKGLPASPATSASASASPSAS
jgi:hypothetical protein